MLRKKYLGEVKLDLFLDALARRSEPKLISGDRELLQHLATKGVMSLRSFRGDEKWARYRKTLDRFRTHAIVETVKDDKLVLTEFGRRVWEETQKETAKKAIGDLTRDIV